MEMMVLSHRWLNLLCLSICALLLTAGCTTTSAQGEETPTPEVFIALTRAVLLSPTGGSITGTVLWGTTPVPGAQVELRTGAWAANTEGAVATTVADAAGRFVLEDLATGDYGLVALWSDGGANTAPVTPVQVSPEAKVTGIDVYLAKELELLEPASGAEVSATPTLGWAGLPDVAAYQLSIIDAGTTELVFDLAITDTTEAPHIVAPPLTPGHTYQWIVNGLQTQTADTSAANLLASLRSEFRVRASDASAPPAASCVTAFEQRELREPYQRWHDQARYTLSTDELSRYLHTMGIAGLCIPPEFGSPFLNVDWDSTQGTAVTGQMISLGFEDLYTSAGWSRAFLLYATYDFATGSEYDVFASSQDRDAVRSGTMPGLIQGNGVKGFVRFKPSDYSFGNRTLYKAFVFPYDVGYVAVVYALGDYEDSSDWDALIQDFSKGAYPPETQAVVALVDAFAASLTFESTN
jgi:hypothetical protein